MNVHAPTPYHVRWYRRRISTYWWLERWSYLAFILREVSSVFVAWFVVVLLKGIRALGQGEHSYEAFLLWLQNPLVLAVNVVTLGFVVFHAVTWFNLAPKAMAVTVGGRRLPGAMIAGANYAVWAVASATLMWLVLGG